MLKVLKSTLIIIGVILLVVTIVLMVWNIVQINALVTVANANQSAAAAPNGNPRWWILLGCVGALASGFVLGAGLGIPQRTFKQRLKAEQSKTPAEQMTQGPAAQVPPGQAQLGQVLMGPGLGQPPGGGPGGGPAQPGA